jgi:6-phosphogluconate dehydrogenase
MQIAILGMNKVGKNIAEKLMKEGHQVNVWDQSPDVLQQIRAENSSFIVNQKLTIVRSLDELRNNLIKSRIVWLMLPNGDVTDVVLQDVLARSVDKNDIVIDGSDAQYEHSDERYRNYERVGLKYLGIGVAGGIHGLENGFSLMVGGNKSAYEYMKPILDSLTKPNGGHSYFGIGGAGHFVKMVHTGIEYGMMQSIAEGFGILAKSDYKLNLVDVGNSWQRGSIIASFLVYEAVSALIKDHNLDQFDGYIETGGEGEWTVAVANKLNVPVPVIEQALEFRKKSQYDKTTNDTFVAKMVAAIRHEFGGQESHKDKDKV